MNFFLQTIHWASFADYAPSLSSALIAGLWQGLALAIVTGIVLHLLPRTTATARFGIWSVVFAASVAMPLLHLATGANAPVLASSGHISLDAHWSYLLAGVWLIAAMARFVILAFEAAGLRKLWQTAQPVPATTLDQAGLKPILAEARVEVCTTSEVDRPSVIGFFAPRILIPAWLFAQLSKTELRHIVLHEMEHLRRRDDWLNLLQKIGLVLFPLNPAMFWIDRRLSTEREIACDDGVLARTHMPRAYASSLTAIAERRLGLAPSRRMVALALGALGAGALIRRRPEFTRRIESILGGRPAGSPILASALAVAVLAGAAAMAHSPELVSFATPGTAPELARMDSAPVHNTATFRNASFHVPAVSREPDEEPRVRRPVVRISRRAVNPQIARTVARNMPRASAKMLPVKMTASQAKPQWLVLTSFEQHSVISPVEANGDSDVHSGDLVVPVSRVFVRMPDGKYFVSPYAAVPTQAGWLILQL